MHSYRALQEVGRYITQIMLQVIDFKNAKGSLFATDKKK